MNNGKSEELLAQLIRMVGTIQPQLDDIKSEITCIKCEITDIKSELKDVKERQIQFELKSEDRHEELLRTIHSLKADQDYIWQKAVRNEREIEKLKNQ